MLQNNWIQKEIKTQNNYKLKRKKQISFNRNINAEAMTPCGHQKTYASNLSV